VREYISLIRKPAKLLEIDNQPGPLGEVIQMNTQTGNKGGLANNLTAQLGLLAIAVVVLCIVAWLYMW
jgi:hypothetical protein